MLPLTALLSALALPAVLAAPFPSARVPLLGYSAPKSFLGLDDGFSQSVGTVAFLPGFHACGTLLVLSVDGGLTFDDLALLPRGNGSLWERYDAAPTNVLEDDAVEGTVLAWARGWARTCGKGSANKEVRVASLAVDGADRADAAAWAQSLDDHVQPHLASLPPAPHNSVILLTSLSPSSLRAAFDIATPPPSPAPGKGTHSGADAPVPGFPGRRRRERSRFARIVGGMLDLALLGAHPARASTPSAALSTALASLRRLAPLLPSPSLSATDDPLNPLELLCADLLPLKLSHGGGLAWRDVEGACALLPLAPRGDSAEQLGEDAWERWLTEKAVEGVVRVLEALNEGRGNETRERVCEWVTGLVRVVEQKVEAQGKGKGKAIVDGSASPPLNALRALKGEPTPSASEQLEAPRERRAADTMGGASPTMADGSGAGAGPSEARDARSPEVDEEPPTEEEEDEALPVSNQLAGAQAAQEDGRDGEAEQRLVRGAAPSPSTGGQKPLVAHNGTGDEGAAASGAEDKARRVARAKAKGKARARSHSPAPRGGSPDGLVNLHDGNAAAPAGPSETNGAHPTADGQLEKANPAAPATAFLEPKLPAKRKKPVAPRTSGKNANGKARAGIFDPGEEGEDELASSEGEHDAPSASRKAKGAKVANGAEKKRKKPARRAPSPVREEVEEDELASSGDEDAASAKGKGKAVARAKPTTKKAPTAPPKGKKPVAPAPNKRVKRAATSSSSCSSENDAPPPRKGKGKASDPPMQRAHTGSTHAAAAKGRKRLSRDYSSSSSSSSSTDDDDAPAARPSKLPVSSKLRARRWTSASTATTTTSAVPAKRKLPARAAAATSSSSSSAPSPPKKAKRGPAAGMKREPAGKTGAVAGKVKERAPPARGSRSSARGTRAVAKEGAEDGGKAFKAGEVWFRNESMGGKVWPVMILEADKEQVVFAVVPGTEAAVSCPVTYTLRPSAARATLASEPESVLLTPAQGKALAFAQALLADKRRKKGWLERAVVAHDEAEGRGSESE
ncbi:hypothetical protein JCM10450v2_008210 [Rhodotorula kratochvilovae]